MVVYAWATIFMDDSLKLATVAVRWESLIEFMMVCNRKFEIRWATERRGVKKLCWWCDCVKNGMILVLGCQKFCCLFLFILHVLYTVNDVKDFFFAFLSIWPSFLSFSIALLTVSMSGIFNLFRHIWNSIWAFVTFVCADTDAIRSDEKWWL